MGCEPPQDGRGLFKPLTRDVQWIGSSSSMDGRASVNGLSSAIQWIGRRDPMDGTRRFNGLTTTRPSGAAKRTGVAAGRQGRIDDSIRRYRRKRRYRLIDPTIPRYWSESTEVLTRPLAGIDGSPGGGQSRSTESAMSVRAKCRGRSDRVDKVGQTEVVKPVGPKSSSRLDRVCLVGLTEIAKGVGTHHPPRPVHIS